jgi:methionyl-tRNA formyltransferase
MAEALDSGDILSQRRLPLADGISGPEADRLFGAVGGEMLVAGLKQIAEGKAGGAEQPGGGSYYSWPTADDFKLERRWSARRAFNFMRGTAEWNQVYPLEIGSSAVTLRKAVAFYPEQRLSQPLVEEDGLYRIQFSPGVLEAR